MKQTLTRRSMLLSALAAGAVLPASQALAAVLQPPSIGKAAIWIGRPPSSGAPTAIVDIRAQPDGTMITDRFPVTAKAGDAVWIRQRWEIDGRQVMTQGRKRILTADVSRDLVCLTPSSPWSA